MNSGVSVPGRLAEWLRLSGAAWPHALSSPAMAPHDAPWVVASWHGRDALGPDPASPGLLPAEYWVDLLTPAPELPGLLGQPAMLTTRTADGACVTRSGLVAGVERCGGDHRVVRHRLHLVPWTWLLTHGRHSRVFQNAPVLAIVQAVLVDYAPWAAWHVGDDVGPFLADRLPRRYCVQYRESDADFLARVLAEEGLGVRLDEAPDAPAGHRLVIFADSAALPQVATGPRGIRFHRTDAAEEEDAVNALGAVRAVGATALTVLSTDYRTTTAVTATTALESLAENPVPLEHYAPMGAYAFANRTDAERAAGVMAQAMEARQLQWFGTGTVRSFRSGVNCTVLNTPAHPQGAPVELTLLAIWHAGVNPLPEGLGTTEPTLSDSVPGLEATAWAGVCHQARRLGYANAFAALPRDTVWRPTRPPKPCVGYQTARVVGAQGETQPIGVHELHCDALGRVRVRFHWQGITPDEAMALGRDPRHGEAADPSTDSCWLRVAQRYAGPGVGTQFLPRIGQEVLVAFLEGDIDRPLVVGALYDGRGDPQPGGKGNQSGGMAPAWHGGQPEADRNAAAMVGFKSKEFGGSGHNRLVLDDSDGELRLQLATTHAASELTLGYLIHQNDNQRGAARGAGFELRTDQWGAVRAERGLWVSAYAATHDAPAGEQVGATALLKQAADLAATLSGIAITNRTPRLAAHEGVHEPGQSALDEKLPPLKALHASALAVVDGSGWDAAQAAAAETGADAASPPRAGSGGGERVPHSASALLGLAAPAGIGLVAGSSLYWTTGETLTLTSGQASNLAVAGDLRVHAGQALGWLAGAVDGAVQDDPALSLVTAEGQLDFEAQNDAIRLQSRDGLRMISANAHVELAAGKTVHLATSGGASITIEGGNISVACPGQITVHAGRKEFLGPSTLNLAFARWTQSPLDAPCLMQASATHGAFVRVT
ncbi:type VI secretion system Vgr family protein [Lysobacter olei]